MSAPWAALETLGRSEGPRAGHGGLRNGGSAAARLELDDVGGLLALRPLHHIKLHPITLRQRAEAVAGDRREVHEYVFAAFALDEAESLRVVEPLDHALHARALVRNHGRSTAAVGSAAGRGAPVAAPGSRALLGIEAIAAVDGTIVGGLERHHGLRAAVGAHGVEHRTVRAAAAVPALGRPAATGSLSLAVLAALLATRGRVGQTVVAVELLLTDGECEFFPAVHTLDDSVLKSSHVRQNTSRGLR